MEVSNYRPISLLTTFSKVIEKIIHKRLYCHLNNNNNNNNNNNILVNEQFGFREKLSVEIATFTLLNKVLSSLDRKNFVGGLFCNLQKAFHCVNHDILLARIEFYEIICIVNKLMISFDVWLTVHHSSMWNKKPTRCHLVLYLFLLYKLLNMFWATLCPSSGAEWYFCRMWCSAMAV